MDREELLKRVDLFSGLKTKDLKSLATSCVNRSYKKGESLVQQGEPGRGLYVLLEGKVKIVKKTAGGDQLEIAVLGPGDFFGEMSVLDDAPRSASVIAVENTECFVLTAWDFNAKMERNPEIALKILPVVVQRFRETNDRLLALSRL
jgi:CRP/FNR family cyclic AMP-dependent transcriptional regulator